MDKDTSLAQRLARLTPAQRARVIQMAAQDGGTHPNLVEPIRPAKPPRIEMEADERVEYFAASCIQAEMWQLDRYAAGAPVYNSPSALKLEGNLSTPALIAALDRLSERHAVLRSTFASADGQLFQRVHRQPRYTFEELRPPEDEALVPALTKKARLPIDLEAGPLMHVTLFRRTPNESILLVVLHHIITDGWSRAIFYRELGTLYQAAASVSPAELSPLVVQYSDYSKWYNGLLKTAATASARTYWRQQLSSLPMPITLRPDAGVPATGGFDGEREYLELPAALVLGLQQLAAQEGTTLFTVLLAAFHILLHRYTHRNDLVVGVPFANRSRIEVEGLIGMFIKTLPFRTRLTPASTFRDVIRQVNATAAAAFEHANLPLDEVLAAARNDDESRPSSPFQVLFALQDFPEPRFSGSGIQSSPIDIGTNTSKVDFYVAIEPVAGKWVTRLEYRTAFLEQAEARRCLSAWSHLLEAALQTPDQEIAELSLGNEPTDPLWLLPAGQQQRLIQHWNRTAAPYPARCVHELFEAQVALSPDRIALVFEGANISYAELNARANRLAHHLARMGAGPGRCLALALKRSVDYVVAVLAILKTGAAYLPLSADEPSARAKHMLSDAGAVLLLAESATASAFSALGVPKVNISTLSPILASCPSANPPPNGTPDSPGYIMFTSGSTGQPKGIVVPHRAIVRLVRGQTYAQFSSDECFLLLAAVSFDASTFELWGPLLNGGTCVIYPDSRLDLQRLETVVREAKISCVFLTSALFNLIVDQSSSILTAVRQIITGGEVLSVPHARRALELNPSLELTHAYGPTETTTFACTHSISAEDVRASSVPIGRPIANTTIYILDENRSPAPIGFPGELYIGGDGVALGYANREDLTAERFLADPYGAPAARMYRTGDRGRYRSDGAIEFLGRMDAQIKLRGFRIEPAEIEGALKRHPEVRECVVIADGGTNPHLVAHVAPKGQPPTASQLRAFLLRVVPEYMVPSVFVVRDSLPISRNGKLDRAALAEELPALSDSSSEAPSLLEWKLLELWQRMFPTRPVRPDDNFFVLGGHSLLAVSLTLEIEKLIGRRLPIGVLFEASTVGSLARRLVSDHHAPKWSLLVPLKPSGTRPPVYFIHGVRGDAYVYLPLARKLPADQPAYGLQSGTTNGHEPKPASAEELASTYADEIQSLQSSGPYYVAGYSIGGWFALAVAHELIRRGERIGMLGLLDASTVRHARWDSYLLGMAHYLVSQFAFHARQLPQIPMKAWRNHLFGRARMLKFHLQGGYRSTAFPPDGAAIVKDEINLGRAESRRAPAGDVDEFLVLWRKYQPPLYHGDIDLFVPASKHSMYHRDWPRFVAGSIRTKLVSGTHYTMLQEPFVDDLAKVFGETLSAAQQGKRV